MEQDLRAHLVSLARAFSDARQVSLSTVGRLAAGDWRFFSRIEDGQVSFTVRKYDEVMAWFAGNWPEGAVWPAHVTRPQAKSEGEAA